jgi:hypothetical protein
MSPMPIPLLLLNRTKQNKTNKPTAYKGLTFQPGFSLIKGGSLPLGLPPSTPNAVFYNPNVTNANPITPSQPPPAHLSPPQTRFVFVHMISEDVISDGRKNDP